MIVKTRVFHGSESSQFMVSIRPAGALCLHQIRLLKEQRAACLVLALFVAAAFASRVRQSDQGPPTCYVVYWRSDPLVERLRREMKDAVDGFRIVVAPVSQFVDRDGRIAYPAGAHSIQLRPPEPDRPHWLLWCWYSGADPSALDPVIDMFWRVAGQSFGNATSPQVRVSALRPTVPLLGRVTMPFHSATGNSSLHGAIAVWAATFFCGCYLPAVILASQREHNTIQSIATSPVGWRGLILSTWVFYFVLTIALASLLLAILNLNRFDARLVIILSTVAYLSLGFTLGFGCRSVISASSGIGIYFVIPALLLLLNVYVPSTWFIGSVESIAIQALRDETSRTMSSFCSLLSWASIGTLAAAASVRRSCIQA